MCLCEEHYNSPTNYNKENMNRKEIKTTFEVDKVEEAINEILRARLVENWKGSLNLETDGKSIILTQYASNNSWQQGYDTIYSIDENTCWSSMISEIQEDAEGRMIDYDGHVKSKAQMFDDIDWIHCVVDDVVETVKERLDDVVRKSEEKTRR
jgi:hypothetical protein